jgi:hypothetical protein
VRDPLQNEVGPDEAGAARHKDLVLHVNSSVNF